MMEVYEVVIDQFSSTYDEEFVLGGLYFFIASSGHAIDSVHSRSDSNSKSKN